MNKLKKKIKNTVLTAILLSASMHFFVCCFLFYIPREIIWFLPFLSGLFLFSRYSQDGGGGWLKN